MKYILHDLKQEEKNKFLKIKEDDDIRIIEQGTRMPVKCIGCFGCWVKDPGICVMKDGYESAGPLLGNCSSCHIVTDSRYGEFSIFTKAVIDRTISAVHPYFVKRDGEMHHKKRYKNIPELNVICYAQGMTDQEKATFRGRTQAMAVNLGVKLNGVRFTDGLKEMEV